VLKLLARKIFERLDLGTNVDVHLIEVERADVTNSVLDVGDGAVADEFVEHVGRRDRDVDALEIEQVFDVAESPVSHYRQRAEVRSIVQDLGHLLVPSSSPPAMPTVHSFDSWTLPPSPTATAVAPRPVRAVCAKSGAIDAAATPNPAVSTPINITPRMADFLLG
jgi:hypothetical protein